MIRRTDDNYCWTIDNKHFYHSIDQTLLKNYLLKNKLSDDEKNKKSISYNHFVEVSQNSIQNASTSAQDSIEIPSFDKIKKIASYWNIKITK